MENSSIGAPDLSTGIQNPTLEVDFEIDGTMQESDNAVNGNIQREPSKHARFKIINHSQSSTSFVDQTCPENLKEDIANGTVNGNEMNSLSVPQPGYVKKRNESESHHNTHHSTQGMATIGYSTTEAVPMTVFYRNQDSLSNLCKQRPTLHELHKGKDAKRPKVIFISL